MSKPYEHYQRDKSGKFTLGKIFGRLISVKKCACGKCDMYLRSVNKYGNSKVRYIKNHYSRKGRRRPDHVRQILIKNGFKKGHIPWCKGTKGLIKSWCKGLNLSLETRKKISEKRAKQVFPLKDTKIEIIIQNELTKVLIPFKKHKLFKNGDFYHQVDIFIKPNICIECDGDYWHSKLVNKAGQFCQIKHDFINDCELEKQGMRVIRLWEYDIHNNLDWCMNLIKSFIRVH